jgi:flagellin-like protein
MKIPGQQRKAISPIVATVLIIAATLIAAAAILGYVFGIFGSSSNTPNISVISASLSHTAVAPTGTGAAAVNTGLAVLCGPLPATNVPGYWGSATLSNSGSASGTLLSLTLTYSGATYTASVAAGCSVLSGGSTSVYVTGVPTAAGGMAALTGQTFNGYITTSAGAQASLTGTWS